jgi:sugar/nucleoside kinase (ribokinase family)
VIDVLVVGGVFRETVLRETGTQRRLGGSGLVAAQAAAINEARVALAAFVGEDDLPIAEEICAANGIELLGAAVTPGPSTSFVFDDVVGLRAPWPLLRPARMPARPGADLSRLAAPVVLVFGNPGWDPWADEAVVAAVDRAETLLWDRQGFMTATIGSAAAAGARCSRRIQLCNLSEVADELGCSELEALGRVPLEGFSEALVKDGAWGVTLIGNEGRIGVGSRNVSVYDVIGSGDAFAGTVAARLSKGDDLPVAARAGSVIATRLITSPREPTLASTLARAPLEKGLPPSRWVPPEVVRNLRVLVQVGNGPAGRSLEKEIQAALRALGLSVHQGNADEKPDLSVLLRPQRETDDGVPAVGLTTGDMNELSRELVHLVSSRWAASS